ncbi:putative Extensin domain-containing protein [Helianthus annuus]|nr:putative Extensin domain-containing protein [Helianthus annuus]
MRSLGVLRHRPQHVYAFVFLLVATLVIADKPYGYEPQHSYGSEWPQPLKHNFPKSPYVYKSPPPVKHTWPHLPYLHKSPPPPAYYYKSPPPQ